MFTEVPRYIGFPAQTFVNTKFAFKSFERTFKDKVPFFVSTFQFKDRNTPIINNLFFDIDSYFSLRIPYRNTRTLRDFCYKHDIPYIINFSGGKGFHLLMRFKPIVADTPEKKEELRNLMFSLQLKIAEETQIEAYDEPTFGRIRFLIRYPTSKYLRRDEETGAVGESGYYCRYLTDEHFDKGLKHIVKIVKEPGIVPKENGSAGISIYDIKDLFKDFKLKERENGVTERLLLQRAGNIIPSIEALGVPCLQKIAKNKHPNHFERIELVSFLKLLGYTDLAINAFVKQLNWKDYKYPVTSYQIRTINPRYPKCSYLKEAYGELCKDCTFRK